MNIDAIGESWEKVQKELFTQEEISASSLRVALIRELIEVRPGPDHGCPG